MERGLFQRMLWLAGLIIALVVLIRIVGCYRAGAPDSYVQETAATLRGRIERPGMDAQSTTPVVRSAWSATMSWEYKIEEDWAGYARWIKERLSPDFALRASASSTRVEFSKYLEGDSHRVVVELISPGPPGIVRVTFTTEAN